MTATTTRRVAYHRGFGSTEATEFFYAHEQIYFLVAKEIFLNAFAAPTTACRCEVLTFGGRWRRLGQRSRDPEASRHPLQ
jgi:hypothetical protein